MKVFKNYNYFLISILILLLSLDAYTVCMTGSCLDQLNNDDEFFFNEYNKTLKNNENNSTIEGDLSVRAENCYYSVPNYYRSNLDSLYSSMLEYEMNCYLQHNGSLIWCNYVDNFAKSIISAGSAMGGKQCY